MFNYQILYYRLWSFNRSAAEGYPGGRVAVRRGGSRGARRAGCIARLPDDQTENVQIALKEAVSPGHNDRTSRLHVVHGPQIFFVVLQVINKLRWNYFEYNSQIFSVLFIFLGSIVYILTMMHLFEYKF